MLRIFLCAALLAGVAEDGKAVMPLSRTVEVRSIPEKRARQELPVVLSGQVIGDFSENVGPGFVLLDDYGGVYVMNNGVTTPWKVGDMVRVKGRTHAGFYASIVQADSLDVLGSAPLPEGKTVTSEELVWGRCDYQLVTLKGVISSAFQDADDPKWHWVLLKTPTVTVSVSLFGRKVESTALHALVDAEVSITGLCMPIYNMRGEFLGSRINLPGIQGIHIDKIPPADPFSAMEADPGEMYNLATQQPILHRRKLIGIVTAIWKNDFFLFCGSRSIQIRIKDGYPLPKVGDCLETVGFIDNSTFFIGMTQAIFRKRDRDVQFTTPEPVDIMPSTILNDLTNVKMFHPDYHGKVLRIKGVLRNVTKISDKENRIHLNCSGHMLSFDIGKNFSNTSDLRLGSVLSITGVCVMEFAEARPFKDFPKVYSFSLIVRSPEDIRVLKRATWWTPLRLTMVIGGLLPVILATLLWNMELRRLVDRRSRELLRENIARVSSDLRLDERTRLAAELHDSFAQNLAGIFMQIEAASLAYNTVPATVCEYLKTASQMLVSCREELRRCIWNLRTQALEEKKLDEAIRKTIHPYTGNAEVSIQKEGVDITLTDSSKHSLLRIVQELVLNAVKHGHAGRVRIHLVCLPDAIELLVEDNGTGFDTAQIPGVDQGHFGLQGVRERVKRFNGKIHVESILGKGTRFNVRLNVSHVPSTKKGKNKNEKH